MKNSSHKQKLFYENSLDFMIIAENLNINYKYKERYAMGAVIIYNISAKNYFIHKKKDFGINSCEFSSVCTIMSCNKG